MPGAEPGVWLPAVRANSAADVFTERLAAVALPIPVDSLGLVHPLADLITNPWSSTRCTPRQFSDEHDLHQAAR
jgi:hypothetical protein